MVLSKTELRFDINRSSSIVVKTIKKCPFLRCSKKSMSALPTAECVTVMFWWQLFVGTNYQKNNFTILRSVVLPSNTNKNILFKARKFLWKLAFLNRSNERGPFEWVRYDTFPSFWNRHSSTEWDENFSEARTFIYLAAVEISALCHHNLLSYDNLKVKNGWVRYLWTCS